MSLTNPRTDMSTYVSELKQRVMDAEAERDYHKSLVESFFSGDVPERASLSHFLMAKWGRKRLEELSKQPALLRSE